jgi:hypothetical protein
MNWTIARIRVFKAALTAIAIASTHCQATATVLYSQDFESTTAGVVGGPGGSGIFDSEINLLVTWEYTASGGANGSKGMTVSFNGTGRPSFATASFYTFYPTASPLVTTPSQINFAIDLKPVGNVTATPVKITVAQTDPNYEADRGIDADGDGDMVDSAVVFRSVYSPTLIDGVYSHVSFTLDQGQINADINTGSPSFTRVPLTPQFDPTIGFTWSVNFGISGFGADAGNSLSVDNIQVASVPEPSTIAMLVGAMYSAAFFKKRRSSFSRELSGTARC